MTDAEARRLAAARTRPMGYAEAERRILDWWRRGYVMFSEVDTKSTRIRRVEG